MKIHALATSSILFFLAINVFAKHNNFKLQNTESVIDDENETLSNTLKGLWFINDDGERVEAVLEDPKTIDFGLIKMEKNVFFHLYTRDSNNPESLYVNDVSTLEKSHFDPARETKIITHGWANSKKSKSCVSVREAYLVYGDYNVIVVDWSQISLKPFYWCITQVKSVGKYVARMIDFLERQGANLDTMTLVGHSLGAHVMGLAGYHARGTVNYIVGLDPGLPSFGKAKPGERISTEDARYVEIIHTNAGQFGYIAAIGTADFYPNGGAKQVNCGLDSTGYCSHCRSYEYFAESINSPIGFYGRKCNYFQYLFGACNGEIGLMGSVRSSLPYKGTHFFKTNKAEPFAMGL